MKNIIIYGSKQEIAFNKLQSLLDYMNPEDIKEVRKSRDDFRVILHNGDCFKTVRASDNARGYKWQFAYIDRNIKTDILCNVIFPTYIPENYGTEEWFGEEEKVCYEWY